MIVELTHNLISSDMTVSHREARCLVECARKAILELYPAFADRYERVVRPHLERVLTSRWPGEQSLEDCECDTVN
jgi:(2Fe-2S) ferredoxin